MQRSNSTVFWPVLVLITTIDFCTKALAVSRFQVTGLPHKLFDDYVRFTLVYNPGAAFGLNVGPNSRWIFMILTIVALIILGRLYLATKVGDFVRTLSLALVCGGAVGNLIDRIAQTRGVVDFIDIGFGESRWPTFNIADMAVSLGAFLLAWVLWGEDSETETVAVPAAAAVTAESRELS